MSKFQGGVADRLLGSGYSGMPQFVDSEHAGQPGAGLLGLLHELAAVPVSEWIVALVCAVIAAIAYELTIKVLKGTKQVTLMLPVLLLRLTRLTTSRQKFRLLYERQWYPDLHNLLTDTHHTAFARYLKGLQFSLALVLGGAIRAARQTQTPAQPTRRRFERLRSWTVLTNITTASVSLVHTVAKETGVGIPYIVGGLGVAVSFCGFGIGVVIWLRDRRRPQQRKQQP
ncbi:hypothetical protein ACIF6L_34160 [Kitasatospora sp. NPDC086009]|uniref:hypothetical protein n=1 Tax=unclassified Kitasatospora TaxID=2633591 RepID=UPI0037CC465B